MPITSANNYPSLGEIGDLVRSIVNDDKKGLTGTAGEGQILTNNSVTLINLMNSGLRYIYRKIRIMGRPTLIRDNYLWLGLPPVNSSLGVSVPNQAVQVSIQNVGYFDGLGFHSGFILPTDMLYPLEMWQRTTGSNAFAPLKQAEGPLAPCNQGVGLGQWEYRGDAIWMNGSVYSMDARLRYVATFQALDNANVDWYNTFIPITDCEEALADYIVYRYAERLATTGMAQVMLPQLKQQATTSINDLRQMNARQRQHIDYQMKSFGEGRDGSGDPARTLY